MSANLDSSLSSLKSVFLPARHYITGGDTRDVCVVCLGAKHVHSALEGTACVHKFLRALLGVLTREKKFLCNKESSGSDLKATCRLWVGNIYTVYIFIYNAGGN